MSVVCWLIIPEKRFYIILGALVMDILGVVRLFLSSIGAPLRCAFFLVPTFLSCGTPAGLLANPAAGVGVRGWQISLLIPWRYQ